VQTKMLIRMKSDSVRPCPLCKKAGVYEGGPGRICPTCGTPKTWLHRHQMFNSIGHSGRAVVINAYKWRTADGKFIDIRDAPVEYLYNIIKLLIGKAYKAKATAAKHAILLAQNGTDPAVADRYNKLYAEILESSWRDYTAVRFAVVFSEFLIKGGVYTSKDEDAAYDYFIKREEERGRRQAAKQAKSKPTKET